MRTIEGIRWSAILAGMLVVSVLLNSTIVLSGSAANTSGKYFDHVVFIAMENQGYSDVFGDGHGSQDAPFLATLLARSGTNQNYHAGLSSGCSEGCYVQLVAGDDYGASNGDRGIDAAGGTIFGRFDTAGITWQAFCEDGCPRGGDHFPFLAINGLEIPSKVNAGATTADYVAALNSANPPNFAWFTPTDDHNMHDNSVTSGDIYLENFLVGTGTIDSPATDSVLASNIFKPGMRTVLVLWWDEYDPAPFLVYGETVKKGYISQASDEGIYSTTHNILSNWGLASLTGNDANAPDMSAYFTGNNNPDTPFTLGTYQWLPLVLILAVVITVALIASRKIMPRRMSNAGFAQATS